ncbi:hypothetical protein HDE76_001264 [Rhodanobacter sp. ANJX3]|uniref:hypothetical protein n=1 Tax=Rhodanobacter sp. ANJX3 TaxID=2723083 RepID=UPI0016194203|nr:hypothetical protein [Rhodanobacter sp. ANJX3]MBB5358058.1 hypothetical protein [Rhodanobacter sp. ANJX3]
MSDQSCHRLNTSQGSLVIEDSEISSVVRSANDIRISLNQAHLIRSGGATPEACHATLLLTEVISESAHYYVGAGVTATHPNPRLPLDFILACTYSQGTLNLQGMLRNEPWFEWEIIAAGIAVESILPAREA